MLPIPELDSLDFSQEPFVPKWDGAHGHIGPVETITPLVEALTGKSKRATLVMMAGVLTWGIKRLESFSKTAWLGELAEASFAWQYDWRYFIHDANPNYSPPDEPAPISAALKIDELLRDYMASQINWQNPFPPLFPLFHMVNVVNYIQTPTTRPAFEAWLTKVISRFDEIASPPYKTAAEIKEIPNSASYESYCDLVRGSVLPPSVLDLSRPLDGRNLEDEAMDFLRGLDHNSNRFLRSPEEMFQMGFEGVPYGGPS